MYQYVVRRLLLLPLTLFCIVLVNFVIVNLAPGDPVTMTEAAQQGATRREDRSISFGYDDRYLQFREFYGLTLPILFNAWPYTKIEVVNKTLWQLTYRKDSPEATQEMPFKDYENLRTSFGDRSRFIMPLLLLVMEDDTVDISIRRMAVRFFIRGGTQQAFVGPELTVEEKSYNQKIAKENFLLSSLQAIPTETAEELQKKVTALKEWYEQNKDYYEYEPTFEKKLEMFFFETRFFKYLSRVIKLDFGTIRNDPNKTVVSEVSRRFKYSLTLAVLPLIVTFLLCQIFGFIMAYNRNRLLDIVLNLFFLFLYAVPVFVMAPFLIEKVALHHYFPFTEIPIPFSGFTSPDSSYEQKVSLERFFDVLQHIALPLIAIIYGSLAAQSRLSRTAILEVMNQNYVTTARAKGLSPFRIMYKHVGRNSAITIVTSIAGSLGIVLGGSLIVETLFEINGFGKFFYDAIINRDYNVIMFSTLAGSFLTLIGYLVADLAYTVLDPRVTLD